MPKDGRFELRIEKAEYQRFRAEADRRGLTVGELVREGVRRLLRTNVSVEKEGGSNVGALSRRPPHVDLGAAHPEKTREESVKRDSRKGSWTRDARRLAEFQQRYGREPKGEDEWNAFLKKGW